MKGPIADAILIAAGGKSSRGGEDETVEEKAERMPISPEFASAARDVFDALKADNHDKFIECLHDAICIYELQSHEEGGEKKGKKADDSYDDESGDVDLY